MKKDKYYYHDENNDLLEYHEENEGTFAHWVNPHLTLHFPHGCKELIPKNIVGFQINELTYMLHKAEEQASVPLTPAQEAEIKKIFTDIGWKRSVGNDGDKL